MRHEDGLTVIWASELLKKLRFMNQGPELQCLLKGKEDLS